MSGTSDCVTTPNAETDIPVRSVTLPFDQDIPRHWLAGNSSATHFFNSLNLLFPDGERFFVRAVQDSMHAVDDPVLRAQVRGFSGQEGRHAHEHERYFDTLRAQGYPIDRHLDRFRRFIQRSNRWCPAALRLSMTAAAEHYTATLGAVALEDGPIQRAHPTMRKLILWHAIEEIEHKAVAFDVLRQAHPSYALRILGFAIASLTLLGWTLLGLRLLNRHDGVGSREARRLGLLISRENDFRMEHALRAGIKAYLRRDFHPNDRDDLPLARARLIDIGLAAA